MGFFSNADIDRRSHPTGWVDRSYPSRRETLGYFMEDLAGELEERGVSMAELALAMPNGLADYYNPLARVRYFDAAGEDALRELTVPDLVAVIGEVAHCLKREFGVTHDLELQATTKAGPADAIRPIPAVA